jgi:hypothetical protein
MAASPELLEALKGLSEWEHGELDGQACSGKAGYRQSRE